MKLKQKQILLNKKRSEKSNLFCYNIQKGKDMEEFIEAVDIESLRNDLIDYYGSAMFNASPLALINLTEIENASDEKLMRIAIANNFDLSKYIIRYHR